MLDELHDRLLGKEADQQLIQRALGEIERLETLVNEMLNFSSMPGPKLIYGQLEKVLEESLFLSRKQFQRQQVELQVSVAEDLPTIKLDADRIKQVFLNLLKNALDAMPEGGTLDIVLDAKDDVLQLRISDTGVGIPADKLPLIFEPYVTSKGQGTGLGLAISYNIISDHEGDIQIQSEVGRGTTVTVSLPID